MFVPDFWGTVPLISTMLGTSRSVNKEETQNAPSGIEYARFGSEGFITMTDMSVLYKVWLTDEFHLSRLGRIGKIGVVLKWRKVTEDEALRYVRWKVGRIGADNHKPLLVSLCGKRNLISVPKPVIMV